MERLPYHYSLIVNFLLLVVYCNLRSDDEFVNGPKYKVIYQEGFSSDCDFVNGEIQHLPDGSIKYTDDGGNEIERSGDYEIIKNR